VDVVVVGEAVVEVLLDALVRALVALRPAAAEARARTRLHRGRALHSVASRARLLLAPVLPVRAPVAVAPARARSPRAAFGFAALRSAPSAVVAAVVVAARSAPGRVVRAPLVAVRALGARRGAHRRAHARALRARPVAALARAPVRVAVVHAA